MINLRRAHEEVLHYPQSKRVTAGSVIRQARCPRMGGSASELSLTDSF